MRIPGLDRKKHQDRSNGPDEDGRDAQQTPDGLAASTAGRRGSKPAAPPKPRRLQQGPSQAAPVRPEISLAPVITNCQDGVWVNHRILLLIGRAGPAEAVFQSTIIIRHHQDRFPSQIWPVNDSHFKALVHLDPGPNRIVLQFMPLHGMPEGPWNSPITINYLPNLQNPPLHLAILVASDSPLTYDCPPDSAKAHHNRLKSTEAKLRMVGYLWQAFTGEQMYRYGFGRRCFRLDEEWQQDTLSSQDTSALRTTAKVHVLRSKRTLKEIRDPDIAQQNSEAMHRSRLYDYAREAVIDHGAPFVNKSFVAVLILDSHWDGNLILGHAALGGGGTESGLAIFGSHAIHTWPACFEEVVSAFTDERLMNTRYCANDAQESSTHWEAANIGIGAFLHEVGHLFGCPHQPNGIMQRDYVTINRSFMTTEPKKTNAELASPRPLTAESECSWHVLDAILFRYHPAFRLPEDAFLISDRPNVFPIEHGMIIRSLAGIPVVTFRIKKDVYQGHIDWAKSPQHDIYLFEQDINDNITQEHRGETVMIEIMSCEGGSIVVPDYRKMIEESITWDPYYTSPIFSSLRLGGSGSNQSSAIIYGRTISSIHVYYGSYIDGLEFNFTDKTSALAGSRGGSREELEFSASEYVTGFIVRAGAWVDALVIQTSKRQSRMFGSSSGGGIHHLTPPNGYLPVGVKVSSEAWMIGFQVLYVAQD